MLSLGTRDGRKGLGFGRQMEATELEEGEACDYQDDDASIDPDVALSYIDDKLQDVLGHFQKDFEGGVSAENLGAKFGGYGSFLPTYQRSPSVWCQPRSPPKVQNHAMQRSPNHLSLEGVHQNSSVPSSAPFAVKHGSASSSAPPPPPVSGVPSVDNSVKKDVSSYPARASVEVIPKHECVNKSVNQNDQKTLKVRIKVGPDSTSVPKNAEIYSGLGLDMSPSSSYDSPAESGGLSPESPGNILQIMTSFPVPGGLLLSPLHDSLIHLSENEKLQRDGRSGSEYKGSQESSGVLVDDSFSVVGISEVVGERKVKSKDRSNRSLEVKIGSGKDSENDITSLSKKETDIETMAGKELVSYASKHPLISSTKFGTGDTTKGSVKDSDTSRVANKVVVKEKIFSSGLVREEALESVPSLNLDVVDKQSSKIGPDKLLDLRRDRSKGNKSYDYDICAPESDATKGRRDLDDGATGGPKHKVGPKVTSREQDGVKRPHVKEQLSSSGKRKSKGSKSNGTSIAEFPKESLNLVSSSVSKDKKKNSQAGDHPLKSRSDDVKSRKDGGMTMDNHGDSIGESVLEKAEDRVGSLEMAFKARQNDSKPEIFDKGVHTLSDKPKHRSGGAKVGSQLALASETFPRETLAVAPLMENGPVSDAVHPPPPSVIEENWVCCDKCQRWRLLPFGMEPTVLPEKWVCSMLDWLSGMNRCDISEEETTRAVYAAYQVPFTEGQNNMHSQLGAAASAVTLDGVQHLDQSHNNLSQRSLPVSAKKRPVNHMGSIHSSSSTKKNQQHSAKSRSLDDVNQLPLESNPVNKPVFQQLSKSGDLAVDKRMHKQKEKQKRLDSYLDGGVSKNSKTKNKREADQSESRSSKKVKTEGLCYSNGEWNSDLGIAQPCSSSGLPAKAPGKGQNKFNEHSSSKDSKHDDRESFPAKKLKDKVLDYLDGGAAQDLVKSDKMDAAAKKRKVKEWQENQVYLDPTSGNHFQDSKGSVEEETSKSGRPKVKKAKASKSEAKESSTSKGDGRTDRKGQVTKIVLSGSKDQSVDGAEGGGRRRMEKGQQLGQYQGVKNGSQRTLDVVDSLKRDLGYGQPPMAATSSSSKVSGSRKTKTNFQEVKGSPVESVSSSPLRFSNPDKLISSGREMLGKDDAMNCGVSVMGSPRRFSDGEGDGGSDRSGMMKKEQTFSVLDHGVMESPVLDYQDKDADHAFNGKGNMQVEHPPEFESTNLVNGDAHTMDRHNRFQNDPWVKDHDFNEERLKNGHHRVNGSLPRKSGIGSSSRSKEKHRSSKSGFDKGKVKLSDSFSEHEDMYAMKSSRYEAETESHDRSPYHQELRDGKYTFQDKCASKSNKNEKTYSGKKDAAFKWSSESGRREKQLKHGGHDGADMKLDVACSRDGKSIAQQNLPLGREGERSSSRFLSEKNDKMDAATGRGKSHSVDKQERQTQCPRLMPVASSDAVDASASGGDASKVSTHHRKPDNHNGASHSNLRHSTPNGLVGVKDFNAPSPARRDSSGQVAANTALKEAKALKHSADRLQDPGSDLERTELYFEAALKFLHAASLLEPFSNEATRSKNVYSETAMLCGFCAREYERLKEMAAAAMAYKCMEVAHMKVIYSKQFTASKDQMELQNALKLIPGESPSSSASDIDNLNNQAAVDKIAVAKDNSSQVAGNHVIVARNRPTFERLLGFTRDVTCAMEASRKSQNAFAAANASLEESQLGEGISSVKRVLEFSFHDVEGLLRLVRLAMQVISR